MFRFDFKDKGMIPPILSTNNADYLERLCPVLEREKIHPSGVVRLRDAAFCEERGIEQLSSLAEHTALLENEDYKRLGHRFRDGRGRDTERAGGLSYLYGRGIRTKSIAVRQDGRRGQDAGCVSAGSDGRLLTESGNRRV